MSSAHGKNRRLLPRTRNSVTHKFNVAGFKGYITVGLYEDMIPGEMFICMSKEGSTISGLMDTIATMISLALQYGVPLEVIIDKFKDVRFEPAGYTGDEQIPIAKSIIDYLARWLEIRFVSPPPSTEVLTEEEECERAALKGFDAAMAQIGGKL